LDWISALTSDVNNANSVNQEHDCSLLLLLEATSGARGIAMTHRNSLSKSVTSFLFIYLH